MVTKRIRSEYMKKFKDPKWETYTWCYEEMLKYRLTRRLLEHTHKPWFWTGPDSDSDSGGTSSPPPPPPPPPSKNQVRDQAEAELEECGGARLNRPQDQQSRATWSVPRLPLQEEEIVSAGHDAQLEGAGETQVPEEERREQTHSNDRDDSKEKKKRDTGGPLPQKDKPSKSSKQAWRSQRVRPAPTRQPRDTSKDSRHAFALYGSGEKEADMASKKTHNVGPAASTTEIHESALRAKTRREVERQMQAQRTERRRRAKSADLDKTRKLVPPEFNPWLTEYMRCFSARSR